MVSVDLGQRVVVYGTRVFWRYAPDGMTGIGMSHVKKCYLLP